ncbi:ATR-interacting protein [Acipenser ruthenus]|uniref:ATR-interacting protein n=1 Tax=Acipenser ruthenus TaxID=7906 RepID=UPI002740CDA9|nr:ATR-interacting protein [Acipenser ruthenus]XP_058855752.1 ATR-interacting protein [Acipenser ruthenus]
MSTNPYGKKKSFQAGASGFSASSSFSSSFQGPAGDHGTSFPPNKRHKGPDGRMEPAADAFVGDDDFTQDDLEEIDILASQAFRDEGSVVPDAGVQSKPNARATFTLGNSQHISTGNGSTSRKETDQFGYEILETHHSELKRKLKEVEDKLLLKTGEIKVLRDSLRQTEQERDQQRKAQLHQEKEKAQAHSDKEKELLKKVQSLQSELHFKEAEVTEMKTKLQSCERGTTSAAVSVSKMSPRQSSSGMLKQDIVASPLATRNSFLTKETFSAEMALKHSPLKVQMINLGCSAKEGEKISDTTSLYSSDHNRHPKGSILLNLLLQHPLGPGSLGLCHLLSIRPDALSGSLSQHGCFNTGSSLSSSGWSTESKTSHRTHKGFSQAQSLAISGLNMLALDQYLPDSGEESLQPGTLRSHSSAVHLLPIVEYHIGMYCWGLQAKEISGKSPLRSCQPSPSSSEGSLGSSAEESLSSLQEFAVTALTVLYHLVSQSKEVVHALLSHQPKEEVQESDAGVGKLTAACPSDDKPGPARLHETSNEPVETVDLLHPLLKKLLQLADPAFTNTPRHRDTVLIHSWKTLNMLAESAPEEQLLRFQVFLSSQALVRCLSPDSSCAAVQHAVRLLAFTATHKDVTAQLGSHLEVCPFLTLYQYVTSRPDRSATEELWIQLELEVVRFLTQLCANWRALVDSPCQCNSEVIKTLVVMLHRQWLSIRMHERSMERSGCFWLSPCVQLFREGVLLLHYLFQRDKNFSEHCLEVLHLHDQVIPGIRDTFRKIPQLMESEKLAQEEMCPPETDAEDMEVDTGP